MSKKTNNDVSVTLLVVVVVALGISFVVPKGDTPKPVVPGVVGRCAIG